MSTDKRAHRRYAVWFPVTLVTHDGEIGSICRDASPSGIQVSAGATLPVGTQVEVRFRVSPAAGQERRVASRVVRSVQNEDELLLVFPFRLGIEFLTPADDLEAELQNFERGQGPVSDS